MKILSNQNHDEVSGVSYNKKYQHQLMKKAVEQQDCAEYCRNFTFDRVLSEDSSQEDSYSSVEDIIKTAINGENATILAYGASGSGKSYTLFGNTSQSGIASRALQNIFNQADRFCIFRDSFGNFSMSKLVLTDVSISLSELNCNNSLRNLLSSIVATDDYSSFESCCCNFQSVEESSTLEQPPLKPIEGVRESSKASGKNSVLYSSPSSANIHSNLPNSIFKTTVDSAERALDLISKGLQYRSTLLSASPTAYRSHVILTIFIEGRHVVSQCEESVNGNTSVSSASTISGCSEGYNPTSETANDLRRGKLHLVELAGFERTYPQHIPPTTTPVSSPSSCANNDRYNDVDINRSLLALETVLYALSHNDAVRRGQKAAASVTPTKSSKSVSEKAVPPLPHATSNTTSALSSSTQMHVPYLNSKLTQLLKDSLAKHTALIITIRPEYSNHTESLYALRYANRIRLARAQRSKSGNKPTGSSLSQLSPQSRYLPRTDSGLSSRRRKHTRSNSAVLAVRGFPADMFSEGSIEGKVKVAELSSVH